MPSILRDFSDTAAFQCLAEGMKDRQAQEICAALWLYEQAVPHAEPFTNLERFCEDMSDEEAAPSSVPPVNSNLFNDVFLAHYPDGVFRMPVPQQAEGQAMVCGHVNGNKVCLPYGPSVEYTVPSGLQDDLRQAYGIKAPHRGETRK